MATVKLSEEEGLERNLAICGVQATCVDFIEAPQMFRFNFIVKRPYTTAQIKRAVEKLHNCFKEYEYDDNKYGGFSIIRKFDNPTTVKCADCSDSIKEAIAADSNGKQKSYISFGKSVYGGYVVSNMEECAHILVAGGTGGGKSCLMNSLIMQLLCYSNADVILLDPKGGAEFGLYEKDVHGRVMRVARTAQDSIAWIKTAIQIMEQRYAEMNRRGIKKYDDNRIVVVIDEINKLMLNCKSEFEPLVTEIAERGRAAGVHLIIATQNPCVQVITGNIKYNLLTKVCLKTDNARHSMNIIDNGRGANLNGKGDALVSIYGGELQRVQCPIVYDHEIERIITHRKSN